MRGPKERSAVRFGVFELNIRTGELRKNGTKLKLQDQPFRVLEVLLEQAGEVVTREELKQRLWPEDTFVDFDNSLNTAVNKLREVLNDSASSPRYVETLTRRGYRFVAPVEQLGKPLHGEREGSTGSEAHPAPGRQTLRSLWIAVIALSVLLTLALLGLLPSWREPTEPPFEAPLRRFSYQPEEVAAYPVISPDGRHIAYITGAGQQARLWVQDLDQDQPHIVQGAEGAEGPFWSPDSRFIGFFAEKELRKIALAGGNAQVICRLPAETTRSGGHWSRDGEQIVFAQIPHIYQVPARGGVPSRLIEAERGGAIDHVEQPHLLPPANGNQGLLFIFKERGVPGHQVAVQSLATNERHVLAWKSFNPVYSPGGYVLYGTSHDERIFLEALPFSLDTLQPTGDPFVVAGEGTYPSVADDGTLAYLEDGRTKAPFQLVWRDREGDKVDEITPPVRWFTSFSASLDGKRVVVAQWGGRLVIYDKKRDVTTRLPFGLTAYRPILAPTAEELAVAGYRNGNFDIFIQPLRGDLSEEPVVGTPFNEVPTGWSADGRFLAYEVLHPETGHDIWYLKRNQDQTYESLPFLQTPANEQRAVFSPDAKFLAYSSNESGSREVYVQRFPQAGNKIQVSQVGGAKPLWSADGKELFYISGEMLIAVTFESGPQLSVLSSKPLFNYVEKAGLPDPGNVVSYQVSEDGQRFLLDEPLGEAPKPSIRVVQNWGAEFQDR